jgi:predicted YcjX-like family ATPase
MEQIDSVIYLDGEKQMYNFPFSIKYNNYEHTINFLFKKDQYADQDSMLRERIDYCSRELFNHFMEYFEHLQEICLDDSIEATNETTDKMNSMLKTILTLYEVFGKIHCNPTITNKLKELITELDVMFLLLEDYYTIERKRELHNFKPLVNNLLTQAKQ